jgi:hypothetical protein
MPVPARAVPRAPQPRDVGVAPGGDGANFLQEFKLEFAECLSEMREFRQEMSRLRDSFVAISGRLDGFEQRLEALERRRMAGDDDGTARLERTIAELKAELDDRDREALLSDLDIGQLPEEKGVSVVQSVTTLAARLGVALEARDVRRAGLASDAGVRVYLNERLTRQNRQLFHRVREECRGRQWRYCWTRRGRVYARQGDGGPAFHIRSDADFDRVFTSRAPDSRSPAI